jgi:hypothetical protein
VPQSRLTPCPLCNGTPGESQQTADSAQVQLTSPQASLKCSRNH